MASELIAGLSAIKTAFDLAKGLQNIHDTAARDRVAIELQKEILSAQAEQAALIKRIDELETKVASFEKWETEKERYQLKQFGGNTFAYELKQEKAGGEPIHRACPNCYQNRHLSVLQGRGRDNFQRDLYKCHKCDAEFAFGEKAVRPVQVQNTSRYNPYHR